MKIKGEEFMRLMDLANFGLLERERRLSTHLRLLSLKEERAKVLKNSTEKKGREKQNWIKGIKRIERYIERLKKNIEHKLVETEKDESLLKKLAKEREKEKEMEVEVQPRD